MYCPIQCLKWLQSSKPKEPGVLLAACGSKLICMSIEDGGQLSSWSSESSPNAIEESPAKKARSDGNRSSILPNIILLHLTSDGQHIVVVTGDDKCVHVFRIYDDGRLEHLSRRCMPKRPSAIAMTMDDTYILIADKFGDVYSIPLLPNPEQEAAFLSAAEAKQQQKSYKPAATTLTVHSQRNLKALEQQLKQNNAANRTKDPLQFSHELLLGHVSMLTDLLSVRVEVKGIHRDYIITADRDEHIRISRSQPQAHIIEKYCLGHRSFISRLCLVKPDVLVSGDGDGHLHVWDWINGRLIKRVDLGQLLHKKNPRKDGLHDSHSRLPISGLWTFPRMHEARHLLVACEGHYTLWYISIDSLVDLRNEEPVITSHEFAANILDIAAVGNGIFVSQDNTHTAGTVDELRKQGEVVPDDMPKHGTSLASNTNVGRLCMLEYDEKSELFSEMSPDNETQAKLDRMETSLDVEIEGSKMRELLYGLCSLRKHGVEGIGD